MSNFLAKTGDNSEIDSDGSLSSSKSVKVSLSSKRKRIHMDEMKCNEHTNSSEGIKPLSNPSSQNNNKGDVNRGLYPVVRHKKRKVSENDEEFHASSQGFVSASDMYNIDQKGSNNHQSTSTPGPSAAPSPRKGNKKIKQIVNQGSMLQFVSQMPASSKESSVSTSHSQCGVEQSKDAETTHDDCKPTFGRSVMYSPIKKVGSESGMSCIYISDSSPTNSPCSSQGSQPNSQKAKLYDNAVVKQLFEAQKILDLKSKGKGKNKKGKAKANASPFIKNQELEKIKTEAGKYLQSDSFDFDKAFGSDMEGEVEINAKQSSEKKTEGLTCDKYGLLGSGSYPKETVEKVNYFEILPPEVLENIFCQLPMLDLCLNSNRVCRQWNDMIADEKFVPWKKLYHKLKASHGTSRHDVMTLMRENGMKFPADYLTALVRYMKNFKRVSSNNMLQCLEKHSKYSWAVGLIDERLTDCRIHEEPNPWCVITLLVILAHTVDEIQEIIQCLSVSWSQCTSKEILECLYCIATFLYSFKLAKSHDVWNGMHYRLFYALYLYENTSVSSAADLQSIMAAGHGQQSMFKYSKSTESVRLTHEQLRIVKHQAGPHEVIKIVAFAGTGKTTTLVRYTQLRPNKNFLLVVYNKSVCEYAKTKFPPNVECRTGHSLAFKQFGMRYRHKLGNLKVYTLTQTLRARKGISLFVQAKYVLTTLENYFSSADRSINVMHVPDTQVNEKTGLKEAIDMPTKHLLVQDANQIWTLMQDFKEKKIVMTHDGYLKLYQLSRPSLAKYDCILIDEAQDLTPAITDILLHQRQGKILVGDPHQQIYSFRGAINAMNSIQADTIFYLTQSFRFGPEIAQVAMLCLELLKKERKKTLVGSGKKSCIDGEQVGQLAIICRCNFTVFSEAVKKCCYSNEECKVAFVGGTSNFGFPMLMDMYALTLSTPEREKEGFDIQNKFIKMFSTFADLEKFATKSLDNELLGKIKIIKTYNHNLPQHIRKIESMCVRDERNADYVFSTAHKAKGLEFSTVRVTDDFLGAASAAFQVLIHHLGFMLPEDGEDNQLLSYLRQNGQGSEDENNLLYVAVTRAKHALQMSPTLMSVLLQAGERFLFPISSEELKKQGTKFECKKTGAEFKPKYLTLQQKTVTLGTAQTHGGHVYSPAYLSEDFNSFGQLLGLSEEEILTQRKKDEQIDELVLLP